MLDLMVRGDLVLPDRVLAGGYLGISDGALGAIGTGPAPPAKATVDAGGWRCASRRQAERTGPDTRKGTTWAGG